eukprot:m.95084 g.95084  ORF g.95084 m.95084 type:complete len:82 (+) comp36835_c1_seq5:1467-1712(+)
MDTIHLSGSTVLYCTSVVKEVVMAEASALVVFKKGIVDIQHCYVISFMDGKLDFGSVLRVGSLKANAEPKRHCPAEALLLW